MTDSRHLSSSHRLTRNQAAGIIDQAVPGRSKFRTARPGNVYPTQLWHLRAVVDFLLVCRRYSPVRGWVYEVFCRDALEFGTLRVDRGPRGKTFPDYRRFSGGAS